MTGWLPVDKPAGVTSAQAVNRLKRLLSARKAGHAGTLDKPAAGVLAVAFGEATKTIPYVMDSRKSYTFRVKFGESTTTDDATGEIMESSPARPSDNDIKSALERFRGEILQVPPQYSAVKVGGRRAAAHAAAGDGKKLAARPLTVYRLELSSRESSDVAEFKMECGKGGYVRSVARDLGRSLGCLGHVLNLIRTAAGPFTLNECAEFPTEAEDHACSYLKERMSPLEAGLSGIPELACDVQAALRIQSGNPVRLDMSRHQKNACAWASCNGRAVAVGKTADGIFYPKRVINISLNESAPS